MSDEPTPAQLKWLKHHARLGGTLSKWNSDIGSMNYIMAGKLRDAGWVTITNGEHLSWPYGWKSTTITEKGRAALPPPPTTGERG